MTRKNFLFLGSDAGGERAAIIYTIAETAKLNGHNPEAYITSVLDRMAKGISPAGSMTYCRGTSDQKLKPWLWADAYGNPRSRRASFIFVEKLRIPGRVPGMDTIQAEVVTIPVRVRLDPSRHFPLCLWDYSPAIRLKPPAAGSALP
ncbi:transposase domain-containing protein [Paeniroseomonas aquatica]|uniref:transposase domain-containing protein n=1 Tax=Paeniroseomonas aquatica TaxID=373043 RepID=UPI0036122935